MTCETLRHLPVLQPLLERTQLAGAQAGLPRAAALVLAYELLLGEGLRPTGPAERAVLQRKVGHGAGGTCMRHGRCSRPVCVPSCPATSH